MSALSDRAGALRRPRRWLAPRAQGTGGGLRLRRIETVVLSLVALVFAVATTYDLTRQVHIDNRLHADLVSWQAITGENYTNAYVELDAKHYTTRDIVCGWAPRVDPWETSQACLIFTGPVHGWRREAVGGYYVAALGSLEKRQAFDRARYRYGCFGDAAAQGFKCEVSRSLLPELRFFALRTGKPRL
jgi:hypothetical protein